MIHVTTMKRILAWLFEPQTHPLAWWKVIWWWEVRRIAFNFFIGSYGIVCLFVFYWAISSSGQLESGEDAFEPIGILAGLILANVCYTFGWLVEVPIRIVHPTTQLNYCSQLLKSGLVFSFIIISIPAALWAGYRLLQFAGASK